MCSGRGTSDADKNREIPSVALQQESLFTLKDRAEKPMARVPKMAREKNFWARGIFCCPNFYFILFFIFYPTIVSIP